MSKKKAMMLVLIGVVMVSYSGPLVKAALLEGATPITVAFLRMVLSACFMLPFALKKVLGHTAFYDLKKAPKKVLLGTLLSALCLALHYFTWMTSLNGTSTFASVALVCTQPLFVAALSYLIFHEKIKKTALPGAMIALLGAALIGISGLTGASGNGLGDILALAGAVFMAAHWLFSRSLRRQLNAQAYTTSIYILTALILLILMPFCGGFALPGKSFLYILGLAIGCTMLGHALFTYALGAVSANVVSFALLFEPVGAMIWAVLFFKEIPTPLLLAGGGCVLAGLALYLYGDIKKV